MPATLLGVFGRLAELSHKRPVDLVSKTAILVSLVLALSSTSQAQISINNLPGSQYYNSFNGFAGAGFAPSPSSGQLDSDDFAISGFGTNVSFGGTSIVGDPARGSDDDGGVSTGGIYSFVIPGGSGNGTLGVQPGGNDFTPGGIFVRFVNDTGQDVNSVSLGYDLYINNDSGRSNTMSVEYAVASSAVVDPEDGSLTYIAADGLSDASAEAPGVGGFVVTSTPLTEIASLGTGVTIPNASELIIAFRGADDGGSGSRDEFAIDNLVVMFGTQEGGTVVQTLSDNVGWRLLSMPVDGYRVGNLGPLNLVQGVPGGQYPGGAENVFTSYTGSETFSAAASPAETLEPGTGFYWYLYDNDVVPLPNVFGGGTSRSYSLPGRELVASGPILSSDVTRSFSENAVVNDDGTGQEGFYMIGNPFDQPLDAFGISKTSGNGTLVQVYQAWDPARGSTGAFVDVDGTVDNGKFLAVWQGVFAQVNYPLGTTATDPSFTFAASERGPSSDPFYGRRSSREAIALELSGTMSDGERVADAIADVWFGDAEISEASSFTLSELPPPSSVFAQLALNEQGRRLAISYRGKAPQSLQIPISFRTTGSGNFVISLDDSKVLPSFMSAELVDLVEQETVRVEPGMSYTFDSSPTDWTDRFLLSAVANPVSNENGTPTIVQVGEVYPNPTSGVAMLSVNLSEAQQIRVLVYDALGRQVSVSLSNPISTKQEVELDTAQFAPGVYTVRVLGETFAESRQLVVAR